jgi:hypothetical protein
MKTLWCKNQENPSDQISHAWAPLRISALLCNNCFHIKNIYIYIIVQSALFQAYYVHADINSIYMRN